MAIEKITYVTSSKYKIEEAKVMERCLLLSDGTPIKDLFAFEYAEVSIKEYLEVDLKIMVQAEVINAYSQLKIPCIVEHAGLIFDDYKTQDYPGGLTKPMWNALGDQFLVETHSSDRKAIARAVVAYCDGVSVKTFIGETEGKLSDKPRGNRKFYWDTVFIPIDSLRSNTYTYAEIVEDTTLGLDYKIQNLSQSAKAIKSFLDYRQKVGISPLWT